MAGKGVAVRKKTNIATAKAALAAEAATIQDQIGAPATNAISTRDKVFTFPDGMALQSPMDVVILDFCSQNKYYPGAYDPKNIQAPDCFAISKSAKGLIPSKNSTDIQNKACDECPMNEFGSAGNGKACKNTRLLTVMRLPDTGDETIYTLSVSPTAIRAFDGYVASVAKLFQTPPIGVITTIGFSSETSYPMLTFGSGNIEANPNLDVHLSRREECAALLEAEPDTSGAEAAKPKTKKRKK